MTSPAHDRSYASLGDLLADIALLDRTDTLEAQILTARARLWAMDDEDPDAATGLLVDGDDLLDVIHRAADRFRSVAYGVGLLLAAGALFAFYLWTESKP